MGRLVLVPIKKMLAPELVFRASQVSWSRARELMHFGKYVFVVRIGDMLRYRVTEDGVLLDKAPTNEADDPFATFSEWANEADEKAYGGL